MAYRLLLAVIVALGGIASSTLTTRATPPGPQPHALLSLAHTTVAPGERQTANILTGPDTKVVITVTFPNAPKISVTRVSGAGGELVFSFVQPRDGVTRRSQTAIVSATALPFIFPGPTASYRIAYAPIDISVARRAFSGDPLPIVVHASPRAPVTLRLSTAKGILKAFRGKTGARGWARFSYVVPAASSPGTLSLAASAMAAGRLVNHRVTVVLLGQFTGKLGIYGCSADTWQNGQYIYLTQVHPGDRMRFSAQFLAFDRGAIRYPAGVSGTVRLDEEGNFVSSAALTPDTSLGAPNQLSTEVLLPASLTAGRMTVVFTVTDGRSSASYSTERDVIPTSNP